VPPSAGRLSKRLVKNLEYFQSNYVCVFLVLFIYCLVSSPLLIFVIGGAGGAAYFAATKNEGRKIAIAGKKKQRL
jgi:anoctamin-1